MLAEQSVVDYDREIEELCTTRLRPLRAAFAELLDSWKDVAAKEAQRQQNRNTKLERDQRKLLQMAYDDEMPGDLVKSETSRLARELDSGRKALAATELEVGDLERRFGQLCTILTGPAEWCSAADDDGRRALNQFLFSWLDIYDGRIGGSALAGLPTFVLDQKLPERCGARPGRFAGSSEERAEVAKTDRPAMKNPPLLTGRGVRTLTFWSGRRDLNPRPPRPERGALPTCATTRVGPRSVPGPTPIPPRRSRTTALAWRP